MRVSRHRRLDLECERECVASLTRGDERFAARADGFEEGENLQPQRFSGGHFRLHKRKPGVGTGLSGVAASGRQLRHHRRVDAPARNSRGDLRRDGCIEADHEKILASVIDGNVGSRLEETQFADPLSGDARRSEIGHAAGIKFYANVGDIDLGRQNRQSNRADFTHRRVGHGQHDIKVVDHQVKNDIDVQRSRRKYREPVRLEEHGAAKLRLNCQDGGIEAFEMAGLENALVLLGDRNQFARLRRGGGNRLFDEQIEPRLKQG